MTRIDLKGCQNFLPYMAMWLLRSVALVCAIAGSVTAASAQQHYKDPDEGVSALMQGVRDGNLAALMRVLGPGSAEIVSSGDAVADAAARKQVIDAFDTKHHVMTEGADKATLIIGNGEWPFPIPLIRKDGQWQFDTAAGREEILFRRIGRNELSAIQACLAYVDAQDEYAEKGIAGNGVYAQHIMSTPGKNDGLYWPTESGANESPLGQLAASAFAEGYRFNRQQRTPYHGYLFRVLTRQRASTPGGAMDYIVRGKMIGGFGLIAYPAEYGNSGLLKIPKNSIQTRHDGIGLTHQTWSGRAISPQDGWSIAKPIARYSRHPDGFRRAQPILQSPWSDLADALPPAKTRRMIGGLATMGGPP